MMRPLRPPAIIRRAAACAHKNGPSRSVASTCRHVSRSRSSAFDECPVPATLTSTPTPRAARRAGRSPHPPQARRATCLLVPHTELRASARPHLAHFEAVDISRRRPLTTPDQHALHCVCGPLEVTEHGTILLVLHPPDQLESH